MMLLIKMNINMVQEGKCVRHCFSKRSLADVISNVLNQILNAVNKAFLRDNALCLPLLKNLKQTQSENHSSD